MDIGTIVTILGGAGSLCAVLFGWASWRRAEKQESRAAGQMISDIGYIKSGIDDLKRRMQRQEEESSGMAERMTLLEAVVGEQTAQKRGCEKTHIAF